MATENPEPCQKFKENYDICFNGWYQEYSRDRNMAKKTLSHCNEMLQAYKSCLKDVLTEEHANTPPGVRLIRFG